MKRVLIVGGGKVGTYLAGLLLADGHEVTIIEGDRASIPRLKNELPGAVIIPGNGTDPALLEASGIRRVDVLAAVSRADETNLVVTSLARFEFNVPRTVARVNTPKNVWLFTPEMGVDVALNQADLMAHMIAEEMTMGDMLTLLRLRKGQFSVVEFTVDPAATAAGRSVRELELPPECVLFAIIRKGQLLIPRGSTVLEPEDHVLAVVHASQADQLAALLGLRK